MVRVIAGVAAPIAKVVGVRRGPVFMIAPA